MRLPLLLLLTLSTLLSLTSTRQCFQGQYLSLTSNTCIQCHISCSTCVSSQGCSSCYPQMYTISQGNKIICRACYLINQGCSVCLSAQKCKTCSAGYLSNSNNTCSKCGEIQDNCQFCNQNGSNSSSFICISCVVTHVMVQGQCVNRNNGTNGTNATTGVNTVATIITTAAINTNNQNSGVLSQEGNGSRGSGQGGMVIVGCGPTQVQIVTGVCAMAVPFCNKYSIDTQLCAQCMPGYLSSNGYCLPPFLLNTQQPEEDNNSTQPLSTATTPTPTSTPTPTPTPTSTTSCYQSCLTCLPDNPQHCLSCPANSTTVDAFPGRCFPLN